MATSTPHNSQRPKPSSRPAMISELAERARNTNWDENGSMKYYLRLAEKDRKDGVACFNNKDYENSFVTFARAASLILEKIPNHRDYQTALTAAQRSNLALNGQEILDNLGQLKPTLLQRYESWSKQHPNGEESDEPDTPATRPQRRASPVRQLEASMDRMKMEDIVRANQDQDRRVRDELDAWRKQREGYYTQPQEFQSASNPNKTRQDAVLNSARQAAGIPFSNPHNDRDRPQPSYNRPPDTHRNTGVAYTTPSGVQMPSASVPPHNSASAAYSFASSSALRAPMATRSRPPSFVEQYQSSSETLLMPLESPTRYEEDSTDSEAPSHPNQTWRRDNHTRHGVEDLVSSRPVARNASYPPPVTTTSPPPRDQISYPQLMSQHQMRQGYMPSLNSMFAGEGHQTIVPSSLLFDATNTAHLYPSLQRPAVPQSAPPLPIPHSHSHSQIYAAPSQPRPQPPAPAPVAPERVSKASSSSNELKQVYMPRDCLPRFLAIAKVNTTMNRETCGLLLGRDKGSKFQVTTLLIPRQHATSDTCTMDEEELVLEFTEERNLITLGWIHTHPSQSCFMSSVDLHTHSGFQRMLPESFAVVCAPKSNPNFGIFRLTDPPGLQTILDCTAGDAFHPHPDVPIYTDADKGHVQMKDLSLEIVDLRK